MPTDRARSRPGDKIVRFKRFAKHNGDELRKRKRYLEWHVTPVEVGDAYALTLSEDTLVRGYVDGPEGPFLFWSDTLADLAASCLPNPDGYGSECSFMRVLEAVDCGEILADEAFTLSSDAPTRARVREVGRRLATSFIDGFAARPERLRGCY